MDTLKVGSKGEDVKKLQEKLGITADGVFGPNTEKAVKKFQENNGLTVDGIAGPKTLEKIFGGNTFTILKSPINTHITKKCNRTIKYLVIHYTAGSTSKQGSALACRKVFLQRSASADFVVDDVDIVQINPDPVNYYCWAVGDKKASGANQSVSNSNSISIEICSNLKSGTSAAVPNHEGWYFTEASLENAAKLARHLIKKYNISFENVIRHFDATGKYCPGIIGWNTGVLYDSKTAKCTTKKNSDEKWKQFKEKLKQ